MAIYYIPSLTSTIFPILTPHYLQCLFYISILVGDSASQEGIWDFYVGTAPGILNTSHLRVQMDMCDDRWNDKRMTLL